MRQFGANLEQLPPNKEIIPTFGTFSRHFAPLSRRMGDPPYAANILAPLRAIFALLSHNGDAPPYLGLFSQRLRIVGAVTTKAVAFPPSSPRILNHGLPLRAALPMLDTLSRQFAPLSHHREDRPYVGPIFAPLRTTVAPLSHHREAPPYVGRIFAPRRTTSHRFRTTFAP